MNDHGPGDLFEELQGEQLSAVTFVQDYLQLWFDGPGINVMTPLEVTSGDQRVTSWQPGFRDLLCAQIAKIVRSIEYRKDQSLRITFADGATLAISLKRDDYDSPEALNAHGFKNHRWFVKTADRPAALNAARIHSGTGDIDVTDIGDVRDEPA